MISLSDLETQLNDFSPTVRAQALTALAASVQQGTAVLEPVREVANLHCHTFFSFNAYGYSPSGLAWLARQRGIKLLGIVDFDVLDAVEEFLQACERLEVLGSAGMETRAFIPEFADRDINSPGEPGVYYYMGIGFTSSQPASQAAPILNAMRRRAEQRNRVMVTRINDYLSPVSVNYERDVLPLTPSGNATERHLLAAYIGKAARQFADPAPFWAEKLNMTGEQVMAQIGDGPRFQNTVRSKLMKRGGVGYAQPGPDTFPSVEEVNQLVTACGALPCAAWLDGLSAGEQSMEALLTLLIDKGAVALNIVPDRNWNIPDPETRRVKVNHLYAIVALAEKLDLPLNIGTEMNAPGQKLVDDFDAPEMQPVRQAFLDGAYFVYGHTILQRALGLGYQSSWAQEHLPSRRERNAFYTRLGRLAPPGEPGLAVLRKLNIQLSPEKMLNSLNSAFPRRGSAAF